MADSGGPRPASYNLLVLGRGLYAAEYSRQVSKHQAALWAAAEYPGWGRLIRSALIWRSEWRNEDVDQASTYPEVSRFRTIRHNSGHGAGPGEQGRPAKGPTFGVIFVNDAHFGWPVRFPVSVP
ncbi:MAG: DUF4111 domain-containing protein [Actinobacteria bacterium]|nr:DUF4111 domain-containing protein [Actinomycetota bacterium]